MLLLHYVWALFVEVYTECHVVWLYCFDVVSVLPLCGVLLYVYIMLSVDRFVVCRVASRSCRTRHALIKQVDHFRNRTDV